MEDIQLFSEFLEQYGAFGLAFLWFAYRQETILSRLAHVERVTNHLDKETSDKSYAELEDRSEESETNVNPVKRFFR